MGLKDREFSAITMPLSSYSTDVLSAQVEEVGVTQARSGETVRWRGIGP